MDLVDAVVLVTGSSRGIGAAIAEHLSARGARVILHGRNIDQLAPAAAALGTKAFAVNLLDPGGPETLAEAAQDVYGSVDGVVHCAGLGWRGDLAQMPAQELEDLVAVNLAAPMRLTRLLLPSMVDRHHGHIAFVASIAGLTGVAREAAYAATKAGLVTFADSLRLELAGSGVSVSAISPGAVRTDFWVNRGVPYQRRFPRPISAQRVAALTVDGIEHERANGVVPRWLAVAPAVRAILPSTYRRLALRFG